MKTPTRRKPKSNKKGHRKRKSLEDSYRTIFVGPLTGAPLRDRLSIYKAVPSITTYGAYERPV